MKPPPPMTPDPVSGRTYTAAVVGLGFIGAGDPESGEAIGQQVSGLDGTHAQALAAHPQVRLIAGSSRDQGRRERFERRLGVANTYADWREMLDRERPEIVGIATNSPHHAEIALACAAAGVRAIFCEKPITTRLYDADRVIAACAASGTILAVNHTRRWNPFWRGARQEILDGSLGEIRHVFAHWASGRLGNVGTHLFDLVRYLLGREAVAVSGTLDPEIPPDCRGPAYRDPGGWGIVRFDGDVRLFVDAPGRATSPPVIRILGSRGQMTLNPTRGLVELSCGETKNFVANPDRPSSAELAVEDIVRCLEGGGRVASTGEDARAALEIIIGFHQSDRRGASWTPLPIKGLDRGLEVPIG